MPQAPYSLAFAPRLDLVPQDHRINAVPALHTPQNIGVVVAGVRQVIAPFVHQQTRATSAGSRVELLARRKEPNGMSISTL